MNYTAHSGINKVSVIVKSDLPWISILDVMRNCFPGAFINNHNELIVDREANSYFSLNGVKDELDLVVKILSGLSRDAYKSEPFENELRNENLHYKISLGIACYFGKYFSPNQMEIIYTYLGNGIRNDLARRFIEEGNLDTDWLIKERQKGGETDAV